MLLIFYLFPSLVIFLFVFVAIKYFPNRFKGFTPLIVVKDDEEVPVNEPAWYDRYLKNDAVFKTLRFVTQYWVKLFIAVYLGVAFYSFLLGLFI